MNKESYISALRSHLKGLSQGEKQEIIADYEEHFRLGTEEGKTEDDIAQGLGNPAQTGKAYLIESALIRAEKREKPVRNIVRAVFAALSLSFLNLILGIPILAAAVSAITSIWAGALACVLGGLTAVFLPLFRAAFAPLSASLSAPGPALFYVFGGIGAVGAGGLLGIGMYFATKGFITLIKRYVRMTVHIIIK